MPGHPLDRALTDVAALFFMTTFAGAEGTEGEVRRGLTVAEVAARARVPQVVYSWVGGAERSTGVPHCESKRRVEQRLTEVVPTTLVRPTSFMDDLAPQLADAGTGSGELVLRRPVAGDVPLQRSPSVTSVWPLRACWSTHPPPHASGGPCRPGALVQGRGR